MIMLVAFVLCWFGFAALALAMNRHHKQVMQRNLNRTRRLVLRGIGVAALSASLIICASQAGWANGVVLWVALLSPSALLVVLMMSYRRHWFASLLGLLER